MMLTTHQSWSPLVAMCRLVFILVCCCCSTVSSCQIDNKQMHACLHTYLERDFSIVEELVKRPPYGQNGHILIEETELEDMCARLGEFKECYERMLQSCVAFDAYSHMKRVIKTIRSVYGELCGQSFHIRHLIEGGYCIEYARKESRCSLLQTAEEKNVVHSGQHNQTVTTLLPIKQQWPFTLTSMLRFELGANVCSYLYQFNDCLTPFIDRRCRTAAREIWNNSISSIIELWCNSNCLPCLIVSHWSISLTFLSIFSTFVY